VPAQNYHQRHQTCCDQHDSYNSQSCLQKHHRISFKMYKVNLAGDKVIRFQGVNELLTWYT
jgi:hypothetical protein